MLIKVAHASMQYSDTSKQKEHDVKAIFNRGYAWITGTEAGEKPLRDILRTEAVRKGYTFYAQRDCWIAVRKNLILRGSYRTGGRKVIDNDLVAGPGHHTGLTSVRFDSPRLGRVYVDATHYPTKGQPDAKVRSRRVNIWANKKLARFINRMAHRKGKGKSLYFLGADANMSDRVNDIFFGGHLTTCWDEVKHWPNTGHGNIDVISSYDHDKRVKCISADALNDKELFLYGDHFLIEATYTVADV